MTDWAAKTNRILLTLVITLQFFNNVITPSVLAYYFLVEPSPVHAAETILEETTESPESPDLIVVEEVVEEELEETLVEEETVVEEEVVVEEVTTEVVVDVIDEELGEVLGEETEEPVAEDIIEEPVVEEVPTIVEEEVIEGDILDEGIATVAEDVDVEEVLDTFKENGMRCLVDGGEIYNSSNDYWNELDENTFETKNSVELGIRYVFPLNEDMTVAFNCLPDNDEDIFPLRIEQVDVSDLDLPAGYEPAYDYAYDVTTDMEDGTFEYDITLPKYEDEDVSVSFVEMSLEEIEEEGVFAEDIIEVEEEDIEQDGDKVIVKGQDHFTVYIPISNSPGNSVSVGIEQCENGAVSNLPATEQCAGNKWVTGAINENKAHYYEGDSVPYRAVFKNLTDGATYTFEIEWDTTKAGKHAVDYLTSFDRTETDADPCSDVFSNCPGTPNTYAIPEDTFMTGHADWSGTQIAGNFSIYNATITGVSGYTNPSDYTGDTSTSITVSFTADEDDWVVLAWGGHISTRDNWGEANSAISISGSPYHMRAEGFTCSNVNNCSVGHLDLALDAGAVIFPGIINIVKEADPEGDQAFNFSGDLGDFSLTDDGTDANTTTFDGLFDFGTYNVTETVPSGWNLDSIVCEDPTQDSSSDLQANTASIELEEGEEITCTFTNVQQEATLTVTKFVTSDSGGTLRVADFELFIDATQVTSGAANVVDPGTYTVSEIEEIGYTASDWGGDCAADGSVTIAAGESLECTITNDDIGPTITLIKEVITNHGGTAGSNDFGISVGGNGVVSGVATEVSANVDIAIDEAGLAGYVFVSITGDDACPDQLGGTVNLSPGEDITCTITNDDIPAKLTVIKVVIKDDGGTAVVGDFNLYVDVLGVTSGVQNEFSAGNYTVSEDPLSGYEASFSGDCDLGGDVTLNLGDVKTCTITNDDVAPTLTLVKVLPNNDGGNETEDDFQAYIDENPVSWSVAVVLSAGVHTAREDTLFGYDAGDWGGDCAADGSVTLGVGENKTCDISNDDVAPKLTLIKDPTNDDGGSALPDDFLLTIGGNPATSGVSYTLRANTQYEINESLVNGYEFVEITGDNKCPSRLGDVVVLDEGDDITCTIVNDDIAPTVTLYKNVDTIYGGDAGVSDFELYLGGGLVISGDTTPIFANTPYSIDEFALVSGYAFVDITGDSECPALLGGTITLGPGESAECTITNRDTTASITLTKVVENFNGGDAGPDDFGISINGNIVTSGSTTNVDSNVPHSLDEVGLSGYEFISLTGDNKCPDVLGGDATLDEGESITCTITNRDIAPTITIIKQVVNNYGGNAVAAYFHLYVGGGSVISGVAEPVLANTSYEINEDILIGYEFVSLTGDRGCPGSLGGTVILDEGEDITCTITNQDIRPTLTLIKYVINDNGGDLAADYFTLRIDGTPVVSGSTEDVNSNVLIQASEDPVDGYEASVWGGDCAEDGTITLLPGENKTCTITNNDIAPTITLIKQVVNNYGGNAVAAYFHLYVGGGSVISGVAEPVLANTSYEINEDILIGYEFVSLTGDRGCPGSLGGTVILDEGEDITCTITNQDIQPLLTVTKIVEGGPLDPQDFNLYVSQSPVTSGDQNGFDAGAYSVYEDPEFGYEGVISGDCDVNGNVSLAVGDEKTCYITNTYIVGSISGTKYHDKDADGQVTFQLDLPLEGWTIFIDENNNNILDNEEVSTATDSSGNYTFSDLLPGEYRICEVLQTEWLQISPDPCHLVVVSQFEDVVGVDFFNFETITISGYKFEDRNGNGIFDDDEFYLDGWMIHLTDTEESTESTETGFGQWPHGYYEFSGLGPGLYRVEEWLKDAWVKTFGDSPYEIPVVGGQDVARINFGNAPLTDIHGYKWHDLNGNGIRDCESAGPVRETSNGEDFELECEPLLGGWFIFIDENGNETYDEGELSMLTHDDGDHFGWYWFEDLFPGEYVICEQLQPGWAQTYPYLFTETVCHTVNVPNNQEQTENSVSGPEYNFGNEQVEPTLYISKSNNTGGTDQGIGTTVLYTIIIEALDNPAFDVTVTDLLPNGFTYVGGSWTSVSSVRGNISGLGEPTYASPGVWTLGDMVVGEIVTLTYQVIIGSSVEAGLYKDLAWAQGDPFGVLAWAQSTGFVDDNFVGTEVNVVVDPEDPDIKVEIDEIIEEVGEVLGLPSTGADSFWLISALIGLVTGVVMILGGLEVRKSKILTVLLAVTLFGFGSIGDVYAATVSVRMEEPDSPSFGAISLTFVTLDTTGSPVTANCMIKGPSAGSFSQFGAPIALNTGGDSGECYADGSVLTTDGTYTFRVDVTTNSDSDSSDEVPVVYDSEGPEAPDWLRKEKDGSCKFKLEFKTENDGETTAIGIYRGGDREFKADLGAQIALVSIGPDEEGDYDDNLSGSECGKTFYYAIRAFDSVGRGSEAVGEDDTVTTKTVIMETVIEEGEAIPTGGVVVSVTGTDGDVEIVVEDEEGTTVIDGDVLGEDILDEITDDEGNISEKIPFWVWVIILFIVYRILRRRRNRNKVSGY